MQKETKFWLSSYFGTNEDEITRMIHSENATSFLIIWSVFESQCFDGHFTKQKIIDYSTCIPNLEKLENEVEYFHKRYENEKYWSNLIHQDKPKIFNEIRKKKYNSLNQREKQNFLLYVLFRYRNNIFHGNKGIQSWLKYETQIEKCNRAMIQLIGFIKHDPEISEV